MTRTALCRACLGFITAPAHELLEAARDHVLDDLPKHRMQELILVDVEVTARRLIAEAVGTGTP